MLLRIGHLSTFYHTAIILMARADTNSRLGVEIDWRLFGTGPAIADAFDKGELDIAYIGLPPAIIGINRGINIICVAGGHVEGTVISGKKELKGFPDEADMNNILSQIKGGRIGVPGKGSIHDVILQDCLEKFNLKKEVAVINFQWADMIPEAMVKGEISVAFGTPALAAAIKRYAGGKILYPPSMLWPNNPSYGIIADKKFLNKEKAVVEQFLMLHEEATAFIRNKPGEASRLIADYIGFIDKELLLDTLKISPKYCSKITEGYISSTVAFVKALKRLGYINREISENEIFDLSLIEKLHPEKEHYSDGISA
ncbi:MAG: ABC transporter substrate-binding protein [Nitrospiraceae bacterium]|nr:MAG: ABC transporter substrate-binding protein [Nitrospiraceae bacterium]